MKTAGRSPKLRLTVGELCAELEDLIASDPAWIDAVIESEGCDCTDDAGWIETVTYQGRRTVTVKRADDSYEPPPPTAQPDPLRVVDPPAPHVTRTFEESE